MQSVIGLGEDYVHSFRNSFVFFATDRSNVRSARVLMRINTYRWERFRNYFSEPKTSRVFKKIKKAKYLKYPGGEFFEVGDNPILNLDKE